MITEFPNKAWSKRSLNRRKTNHHVVGIKLYQIGRMVCECH